MSTSSNMFGTVNDDDDLYDPFERKGGAVDPNPFDRPPRAEDEIPRHKGDGRPHIWLPDGSKRKHYSRPSGWGDKIDDQYNISRWTTRMTVNAFLDLGSQSDALQIEHAAIGPSEADQGSKQKHNELNKKAKGLVADADRVGTALHAITERWDYGLPVTPPNKFKADLEEWKRLTRNFEIIEMPDGRPGIECFVVMDARRPGFDGTDWTHWVRLAGTFDRLVRYHPCPVVVDETGRPCGRRVYVLDLKSGKAESLPWGEASIAVQLGTYANSKQYVPWLDGKGADRLDIPDVCPHRAIVVSLPAGTGRGRTLWVNVEKGFRTAIDLVPRVVDHRKEKGWMADFFSVESPWTAIDRAETPEELHAIWRRFPDLAQWEANDRALINHASARMEILTAGAF